MEAAVEHGRGRWGAAVGLTLFVLLLSVFDAVALVLLPVALLLVALPGDRRLVWFVAGGILWFVALVFPGGPLAALSRGWALMLGATFLAVSVVRPRWSVLNRAIATVGTALGAAIGGLAVAGETVGMDRMIREHFRELSEMTVQQLQTRVPNSPLVTELAGATERIAGMQADLFPALLALQSIAALALAAWWVHRLGRASDSTFKLGRLRDFRFNDQLIWILIASLVLMVLPAGVVGERVAINGLLFMIALYAFRGLAIFVFLASGSKSIPTMVFGVFALIFLYPVAFTAALLMGVGDTWLDVRGRIEAANTA